MAIGATLGLIHTAGCMIGFVFPAGAAANGVRHIGAEGDAAHAIAADGLLLGVDRFAVGVVAGDVNGATTARRPDPVAGNVAIASEHVDVVAERLEVITGSVSRDVAGVVKF